MDTISRYCSSKTIIVPCAFKHGDTLRVRKFDLFVIVLVVHTRRQELRIAANGLLVRVKSSFKEKRHRRTALLSAKH